MKLAPLALLAIMTGSAYAEDRIDPPGAADSEVLRGTVLVWTDATLYTEPSVAAQALHAASLPAARKDSAGEVMPMRVVAVAKDGFVEVEPANDLDCTWSRLQTSDDLARLRLFVKRADLAPVLVAPYAKAFPDGTRIALRSGVAVVPTDSGKFVVAVRGGEVIAELPSASIGHAYTPDRTKSSPAVSDREYELAPKTAVTLGDRSLALEGRRATTIERRGATTLFSIQTRCVEIDVAAPSKSVRAVDDDESSIESSSGLGVLDLRDHDYIPAGTLLATPTGRQIAVAAKPIYLRSAPHGKTACFERHVRVEVVGGEASDPKDGDDKLRICAPSSRVVHERMRSASSASGTTGR